MGQASAKVSEGFRLQSSLPEPKGNEKSTLKVSRKAPEQLAKQDATGEIRERLRQTQTPHTDSETWSMLSSEGQGPFGTIMSVTKTG